MAVLDGNIRCTHEVCTQTYSWGASAPLTLVAVYNLFQKKRTFNSEFFVAPLEGGGQKIHMVDYVDVAPLYQIS